MILLNKSGPCVTDQNQSQELLHLFEEAGGGDKVMCVSQHVKHVRCLKESVAQMDKEIALNLTLTIGAFLTNIRVIDLVLAAGVTAEIGDLNGQKSFNNLASY